VPNLELAIKLLIGQILTEEKQLARHPGVMAH
jgi:hypothetical protein